MKRFLNSLTIPLLALAAFQPCGAEESALSPAAKPFANNTRYVAVGDSITHGGWYIRYIDFYYLTRFPNEKITVVNSGANGEASGQFLKRYSLEVASLHPDVVSVMYGMNDGGLPFYAPDAKFSEPLDTLKSRSIDIYEKNLKTVVQQLLKDKIQVIVLTPSPYDDSAKIRYANHDGYNTALGQIALRAKKVAQELGVPMVDFYTPMQKINQEKQAADPAYTIVGMDRTHPGPVGHLVMAYQFLKAQNAPADVARFSIKGTNGTVQNAINCQIDQCKVAGGSLTFQYSANAIPIPFERWAQPALKMVPFTVDLNREIFQVTDLPAGAYELQIDGQLVRTCTSQELAAGVNLSETTKTPQYQQAMRAWRLHEKEFDCYAKLRDISSYERSLIDLKIPRPLSLEQVNNLMDERVKVNPGSQKKADALKELKSHEAEYNDTIKKLSEQIRALVMPQPHMVKIQRVANAGGDLGVK